MWYAFFMLLNITGDICKKNFVLFWFYLIKLKSDRDSKIRNEENYVVIGQESDILDKVDD